MKTLHIFRCKHGKAELGIVDDSGAVTVFPPRIRCCVQTTSIGEVEIGRDLIAEIECALDENESAPAREEER